jgi:two-component system response regulator DesR
MNGGSGAAAPGVVAMRGAAGGHAAGPAEGPRAPVRVLLADGHRLLAGALAAALPADPALEVVGVRPDLAAGPIRRAGPDVLVLGYPLLRAEGRRLAELRAEAPELKALVLTAGLDDETVAACVRAGAAGCVARHQSPADLGRAIRRAHAGEVLFPPEVLVRLLRPAPPRAPGPDPPPRPLSARERQVLSAAADGLSVDEAAERLVLSPHTVRSHLKGAMGKLGARSRLEAVLRAAGAGLIELPGR